MIYLYSFLDGKEQHIDQLLASLVLSKTKPERVLFLTKNKYMLDNFTYLFWKQKLEKHYNIICDIIPHNKNVTSQQQHSIARRLMRAGEYRYGLFVHEQAILQPQTITSMVTAFADSPGATPVTDVMPTVVWPDETWCLLEPEAVCHMFMVEPQKITNLVQLTQAFVTFSPSKAQHDYEETELYDTV